MAYYEVYKSTTGKYSFPLQSDYVFRTSKDGCPFYPFFGNSQTNYAACRLTLSGVSVFTGCHDDGGFSRNVAGSIDGTYDLPPTTVSGFDYNLDISCPSCPVNVISWGNNGCTGTQGAPSGIRMLVIPGTVTGSGAFSITITAGGGPVGGYSAQSSLFRQSFDINCLCPDYPGPIANANTVPGASLGGSTFTDGTGGTATLDFIPL